MFLIPVELCSYVLTHKLVRPFQIYLLLKSKCDGIIQIDDEVIEELANELGLKSTKTIRNNIKILLKKNWIGHNEKTGNYFIRGFDRLRLQYDFSYRRGAIFDLEDMPQIKGFLVGAIIGSLVNTQKRKRQMAEPIRGRSLQAKRRPTHFPIANKVLSECLNISLSTASIYKNLARRFKFIHVQANWQNLNIDATMLKAYKKAHPELAVRVKIKKGKLHLLNPDMVCSNVPIKRRLIHPKFR